MRLSQDPAVDLSVANIGEEKIRESEERFMSSLGIRHNFIPLDVPSDMRKPVENTVPEGFRFLLETWYQWHGHVGEELAEIVDRLGIQTVIIDYLYGFLFCNELLKRDINLVYVAQNRETEFFLNYLRPSLRLSNLFPNLVRVIRCAQFERRIFNICHRVICLSGTDVPKARSIFNKSRVITPYLDPSPLRWRYAGNKKLLFVGSIGHYPNLLACRWLMLKLAPALHRADPAMRILIVSREKDALKDIAIPANVELIHDIDDEGLDELYTTCDLFVSPIKNDFGIKFKVLQCLSCGTPFVATSGCLVGLPFLGHVKPIALSDAHAAAKRIVQLVSSSAELEALSQRNSTAQERFVIGQTGAWTRALLD